MALSGHRFLRRTRRVMTQSGHSTTGQLIIMEEVTPALILLDAPDASKFYRPVNVVPPVSLN